MTEETNVNKYQHNIRLLTTIYMTVKNELLNKIITCVYPPMPPCISDFRLTDQTFVVIASLYLRTIIV